MCLKHLDKVETQLFVLQLINPIVNSRHYLGNNYIGVIKNSAQSRECFMRSSDSRFKNFHSSRVFLCVKIGGGYGTRTRKGVNPYLDSNKAPHHSDTLQKQYTSHDGGSQLITLLFQQFNGSTN